jgi:Variant SH3 domain
MVEYVYARHEFAPEHEDEIAFCAGERIEVVEKDEIFNDGWWQVSIAFFAYCVPIQYPLLPRVSPFYLVRPHGFPEASLVLGSTSLLPLIPIPFASMSSGPWVPY